MRFDRKKDGKKKDPFLHCVLVRTVLETSGSSAALAEFQCSCSNLVESERMNNGVRAHTHTPTQRGRTSVKPLLVDTADKVYFWSLQFQKQLPDHQRSQTM